MCECVDEDYQRAAQLIKNASIILVMTGAGMSAESGLKTYEEINQEISDKNLEYSDYCDPDLLRDDPIEFWKFWSTSAEDYQKSEPHKGYIILKKWRDMLVSKQTPSFKEFIQKYLNDNGVSYDHLPSSFYVYTSNVDGLFRKCGIPSTEILEIHGNANLLQCQDGIGCKKAEEPLFWSFTSPHRYSTLEELPRCPYCQKVCRPSVLMFNDEEWLGLERKGATDFDIYDYWEEGVEAYLEGHEKASIVILEIGCGDRVPVVKMESETVLGDITNVITRDGEKPVDRLEERVALIRINTKKSAYLDFHKLWSDGNTHIDPKTIICLEGQCGEVLEQLDSIMYLVCFPSLCL